MIDFNAVRANLIELAVSGKLSASFNAEDSVESIANALPIPSDKRNALLGKQFDYGKRYNTPENWKWFPLGIISSYGDTPVKARLSDVTDSTWVLDLEDIKTGGELITKIRARERRFTGDKSVFRSGQILYSKLRPYLKKVLIANEDGVSTPELISFDVFGGILPQYIVYCLLDSFTNRAIDKRSYGIKMPRIDADFMANLPIPIPPISEQEFIINQLNNAFAILDTIERLNSDFCANQEALKRRIIDSAIQGKMTERLPEDGTSADLIQIVQKERKKQEKDGTIKKVKAQKPINPEEIPFEIPDSWEWVRFGDVAYIVRGGSPRPISQYITNDENGINWIKIGDVERGGKYIYETKEKIIPQGEAKSRRVYPGDFLLTNSMSYGRPYISRIEGCIHDGWLLIHDINSFDQDYLYYLLSSGYINDQFTQKASGSTVDNLNIDKVSSAIIPLPPIAEQKRIVQKIEEMMLYFTN